jgi:hypothetical protein
MTTKKKDLFFINAIDLVKDIDFELITDTPFHDDIITHFYEFENHKIDYELIQILGLGVVKNIHIDNDYYVYNASNDHLGNNFGFINEVVRIGAYYQITHPDYDDKELEKKIFKTKHGKEYLKKLQTSDTDIVLYRLKEIFDRKKGEIIQLF